MLAPTVTIAEYERGNKIRNMLEALQNLTYLIHVDAHEPSRVRQYAAQSETVLRDLHRATLP